jgi:hypothetical protein
MHVSERTQVGLVRALQALMVGILGIGLYTGNLGIAFNAAVGLLVTRLCTFNLGRAVGGVNG